MRNRNLGFPGVNDGTAEQFSKDVASDDEAIAKAIRDLREKESVSLEVLSFVLGAHTGQLSRQLKGDAGMTVTSYLRIARALGYRCDIVFRKASSSSDGPDALETLKLGSHRVTRQR